MTVSIENVKPHIGGIVHVDKAEMCQPDVVAKIKQALEDRGVLVFPQIHLTDAEQLAFTDAYGERVNFTKKAPGSDVSAEDVYKVTLDKKFNPEPDYVLGTWFWHMDGVTIDQPLPKATMLSARKLSDEGGQTEFASTFAAWEQLPEAQKKAIEGLKVIHRLEATMRLLYREMPAERLERYRSMATEMVHPLVWTHPDGRKSLVLGTTASHIEGWDKAEGRAFLDDLLDRVTAPEHVYTHEWEIGDLVIWDNRGALHRARPYSETSGRRMSRTTLVGDEAIQ